MEAIYSSCDQDYDFRIRQDMAGVDRRGLKWQMSERESGISSGRQHRTKLEDVDISLGELKIDSTKPEGTVGKTS